MAATLGLGNNIYWSGFEFFLFSPHMVLNAHKTFKLW